MRNKKTRRQRKQKQRGGADLPIPAGSVASVRLDPKDEYSAPVLVGKEEFEEEVLED